MTDKVFLDTNVLIAFVFFLNSLHGKSNDVLALSNILWVVVLDCDFFVQDIAFIPSYSHVP